MRKVFSFFGSLGGFLLLVYLILYAYDQASGNGDGLIKGYAYRNIFSVISIGWLICFLLGLGTVVRNGFVQNVSVSLFATFVMLLLLELLAFLLYKIGITPFYRSDIGRFYVNPPPKASLFSGDFHPAAGRWRVPNGVDKLVNCEGDSLTRLSNSYGAYDKERSREKADTSRKRIVIVGDSFLEGYMVNAPERTSNLLEQKTGLEHLNFAENGTSPINYYLIYKHLAKQFDHDAVIIGLLPANDFEDFNETKVYSLIETPIFRPYWYGNYPSYQLRYSLADAGQSAARNERDPKELLRTIDSVYNHLSVTDKLRATLENSFLYKSILFAASKLRRSSPPPPSRYSTVSEKEFKYLVYSIERLAREAGGKQVILLSIPILTDVESMRKGDPNRLDPLLARFCKEKGIDFIPFLPHFLAYRGRAAELFVPCDGHWSRKGEQFVTSLLLANPLYRKAVQPTN